MPGASATLTALVEAAESDPTTVVEVRAQGDALAEEVGGELALRWGISVIKALIADPPDGDSVREAYGELVDRHRGDDKAIARLKPLGDEIRRLEADGTLPSAMVARSVRKPGDRQARSSAEGGAKVDVRKPGDGQARSSAEGGAKVEVRKPGDGQARSSAEGGAKVDRRKR